MICCLKLSETASVDANVLVIVIVIVIVNADSILIVMMMRGFGWFAIDRRLVRRLAQVCQSC
jgi:hypothetical protein